jgi:phosphatidylglycerol:prolipoprotein diacylglycerol transferase
VRGYVTLRAIVLLALIYPDIDPVALELGPFVIRWYALAYIAGLLIGWRLILRHVGRVANAPMTKVDVDDFLVWAIVAVILGGRIGYMLFYNAGYYLAHPSEALFLWRGGMSFHGGLVGVVVALWWFCRRRDLALLPVADLIASVAPVGLFFGRLANFINGELWGRQSDVPWAMAFPGAGDLPRHPSQLYEALLEGAVLFVVLQWMLRQERLRERHGIITGAFLIGYGLSRMFIELFREPDRQIGFLPFGSTLGQWLSVPLVLGGLYLWTRARPLPPPRAAKSKRAA